MDLIEATSRKGWHSVALIEADLLSLEENCELQHMKMSRVLARAVRQTGSGDAGVYMGVRLRE